MFSSCHCVPASVQTSELHHYSIFICHNDGIETERGAIVLKEREDRGESVKKPFSRNLSLAQSDSLLHSPLLPGDSLDWRVHYSRGLSCWGKKRASNCMVLRGAAKIYVCVSLSLSLATYVS